MNCIVIDDEPLGREGMRLNIDEVGDMNCIGEFEDAMSAYNFLSANQVDLMFVDIQMPGEMNGLDLIKSLKNPPLIVVTTAFPEYAVEGFQLDVVDYLVKPISMPRFIQAVEKARKRFDQQSEDSAQTSSDEHIFIKADRKFIKLHLNDIAYIKGMKDYVMVYTEENKYMTAMNIKTIYNQLPDELFVRVSKSYIINSTYIKEVNQSYIKILGEEIPIGKTYKESFLDKHIRGRLIQRK